MPLICVNVWVSPGLMALPGICCQNERAVACYYSPVHLQCQQLITVIAKPRALGHDRPARLRALVCSQCYSHFVCEGIFRDKNMSGIIQIKCCHWLVFCSFEETRESFEHCRHTTCILAFCVTAHCKPLLIIMFVTPRLNASFGSVCGTGQDAQLSSTALFRFDIFRGVI